jgi:ribulose-phosphate 3-epimerase
MSVNPGFGGQSFIEYTLEKIKLLKAEIRKRNLSTLIEIDGGVTLANARTIIDAGEDVLVAGNTVFSAENPSEMIQALKRA